MKFHPDGLILVTGHQSGKLNIWDIRSQQIIKTIEAYQNEEIESFSFSNRGFMFACSGKSSNSVKLYDMRNQF